MSPPWLPWAVDLSGLDASPAEVRALGEALAEVEQEGPDGD